MAAEPTHLGPNGHRVEDLLDLTYSLGINSVRIKQNPNP